MADKPEHKLVVLGDSISQGFQNGGIYRTDLGFPSFLAHCFEPEPRYDLPLFTAQGGIPLNLEVLARGLSDEFGTSLEWTEYLPALKHLYTTLRRIKNHWEGNRISLAREEQTTPYHNQSVWGFSMNDAWMVTEEESRRVTETEPEAFSIFSFLPVHAMYVTARLVLNPTLGDRFAGHTQLDNVRWLQEHGGIENLIVCMGHNNVIGAVTDLRFDYSEEKDLRSLPNERGYTVYRPEHFRREFEHLAEEASRVGAGRVITQTIPYVTIPPVTRGINEDPSAEPGGYFDYYTRFWIWDSDFDPGRHPYLTKEQAIELDQVVDEYNQIIREVAARYGWITVPLNRYVSAFARRRIGGPPRMSYPEDFREAMLRNPATRQLVEDPDRPLLSSDYLRVDPGTGKVNKGGIFSLDGIHPTTIGYGLIAHLYYQTMEAAGVSFGRPLDWDRIIASDTLVTDPPEMMAELRQLLRFLSLGRNRKVSMLKEGLLDHLMSLFSPRRRGSFD